MHQEEKKKREKEKAFKGAQEKSGGQSAPAQPPAAAQGTAGQGSTEDVAKALKYILKEIDLGQGPQLQIKTEGGKSFSPFDKFFKSNPGFVPNEEDLPMFNKYQLFMPQPEPVVQPPPGPQSMNQAPQGIMQALGGGQDPRLAQILQMLG